MFARTSKALAVLVALLTLGQSAFAQTVTGAGLSRERICRGIEDVFEKNSPYLSCDMMVAKSVNRTSAELHVMLEQNRKSYRLTCGVGAIVDFVSAILEVIPLTALIPSLANGHADIVSQGPRQLFSDQVRDDLNDQTDGVNSSIWLGSGLGLPISFAYEAIENAARLGVGSSITPNSKFVSNQFRMSKASLAVIKASHTRLVGKNSACGRSLARAAALRTIIVDSGFKL